MPSPTRNNNSKKKKSWERVTYTPSKGKKDEREYDWSQLDLNAAKERVDARRFNDSYSKLLYKYNSIASDLKRGGTVSSGRIDDYKKSYAEAKKYAGSDFMSSHFSSNDVSDFNKGMKALKQTGWMKDANLYNQGRMASDMLNDLRIAAKNGERVSADQVRQSKVAVQQYNNYLRTNKDAIQKKLGRDTYNSLVSEAREMKKNPALLYYSNSNRQTEPVEKGYNQRQSELTKEKSGARKTFYGSLGRAAGEFALSAAAAFGGGNANDIRQQFYQGGSKDEVAKNAAEVARISNEQRDLYNEHYTQLLTNNQKLRDAVAVAANEKQKAKQASAAARTTSDTPDFGFIADDARAKNSEGYVNAVKGITDMGYSKTEAEDMINLYEINRDAQFAEGMSGQLREFAEKHPVASVVPYVAANTMQISALPNIADYAINEIVNQNYRPINTNSDAFLATNMRNAISEGGEQRIANDIMNAGGNESAVNVGKFLYQTGLSIADFYALGSTLGKLSEGTTLAIMGMGAAASTAKNATERGLGAADAVATSFAAGAAEIIFEKLSLDKLLKIGNGKTRRELIMDIAKQTFTEGSEEFFTDIGNALSDYLINADNSELMQKRNAYMRELMKQGYSKAEAKKKADGLIANDFGKQLLESFAGGALSGGVSGTMQTVKVKGLTHLDMATTGREIRNGSSNVTDLPTLVNVANSLGEGSKAYQMLEKAITNNKNVSDAQIGELYNATVNDIVQQFNEAETLSDLTDKMATIGEAIESSSTGNEEVTQLTATVAQAYTKAVMRLMPQQQQQQKKATAEAPEIQQAIKEETKAQKEQKAQTAQAGEKASGIPVAFKINAADTQLTSVADASGDTFTFNTADGRTVSSDELEGSIGETEARIIESAEAGYGINTSTTQSFGENGAETYIAVMNGTNVSGDNFTAAESVYKTAYMVGRGLNATFAQFKADHASFFNNLDEAKIRAMFDAGRADAETEAKVKDEKSGVDRDNPVEKRKETKGEVTGEADELLTFLENIMAGKTSGDIENVGDETNARENASHRAAVDLIRLLNDNAQEDRGEAHALVHEQLERVKAYNPEGYKLIVRSVLDFAISRTSSTTVARAAANYRSEYLTGDKFTSMIDANHEMVNDLCAALICGNETAQKEYAKWLVTNNDRTTVGKIKEIIQRIIKAINQFLNRGNLNAIEREFAEADAESATRLVNLITEQMDAANRNAATSTAKLVKTGEGIVDANGVNANVTTELANNGVAYDTDTQSLNRFDDTEHYSMKFATDPKSWANPTRIHNESLSKTDLTYKEALIISKTKTNLASGEYANETEAEAAAKKWAEKAIENEGVLLNYYREMFGLPQVDANGRLVTAEYDAIDERAIKKDSDYPQGTIDFNNDCPKRMLFTRIVDAFLLSNPNIQLNAALMTKIRAKMSEKGYTVACGLCYVEDRRQQTAQIAADFIKQYEALKGKNKPFTKTSSSGKVTVLHISQTVADKYGLKKGAEIRYTPKADGTKLTQYDLNSLSGFLNLQRENPLIAAAFEQYNNSRGQQAARLLLGRSEYNREILTWTDDRVKFVNEQGGLRIFSFSDFEVVHMLDIMQILMDCEARGVKIQGYTKQSAFADFVAQTGLKLNRSFIPMNAKSIDARYKGDGYHYDEDFFKNTKDEKLKQLWSEYVKEHDTTEKRKKRNGFNRRYGELYKAESALVDYIIEHDMLDAMPLDFDGTEGIGGNDSSYLNDSTDNVGNIVIGVNDFQIRRAMADDRIHFIIPFHSNKKADTNKRLGVGTWWNYKNYQVDKWLLSKKEADARGIKQGKAEDVNLYTEVIDELTKEGKPITEENVFDKYIERCNEQGKRPRFDYFLNRMGTVKNEKTGKSVPRYQFTKGYYKLLVDFKLFDTKTGRYLPQQTVSGDSVNIDALVKAINGELQGELEEHGKDTRLGAEDIMVQQLLKANPDMTQEAAAKKAHSDLSDIVKLIGDDVGKRVKVPSVTATSGKYSLDEKLSKAVDIGSETDQEYIAAVESGNEAEAQRLVDEAAIEWGAYSIDGKTPLKLYHSTNAEFTKFKKGRGLLGDGIYFSKSQQSAYGKRVISAYIKANNPINLKELPKGARVINDAGIEMQVIPDFFEKFPQYDAIIHNDALFDVEINVKSASQIKSADPITYDDEGNVIPLSKRFSDSPDLRYSRSVDIGDESNLVKENAELKKALDYFKTLYEGGHLVKRDAIRRIAIDLKREWASTTPTDDVVDAITRMYDFISKGDATWDMVREYGLNAVEELLATERKELDPEAQHKLDIMRSLAPTGISVTEEQRAEIESKYGNFRSWMNIINRGVKYRRGGIAIEDFWRQLQANLPELIDDVNNDADMAIQIAEITQALTERYTETKRDTFDEQDVPQMILMDLWAKYFDAPEIETEIQKVVKRYQARYDKLKSRYDKYKGKVVGDKIKREAREKIRRLKKNLDKMLLKPTEKMYVPQELVKQCITVCSMLSDAERYWKNGNPKEEATQLRLDALQRRYADLLDDDDYDYASAYDEEFNKKIIGLVDALNGRQLTELTPTEMEEVYQAVKTIYDTLRDATIQLGKDEKISNHMRSVNVIEQTLATSGKGGTLVTKYEADAINPMRYIRRIAEYNGDSELVKLFDEIEQGVFKMYAWMAAAEKPFMKLRNGENEKAFNEFATELKDYGLKDKDGKPVLLTEAQAVQLLMTAKREEGYYHIDKGGVVITDVKEQAKGNNRKAREKGKTIASGQAFYVLQIEGKLSDYGKQWLEASRNLMDNVAKNAINETSLILRHRKIATGSNYIHIEVLDSQVSKELEGLVKDATLEASGYLTETVKNASQTIIVRGITDTVENQIDFVSKYYGLAIPIRNFNKVYNGRASRIYEPHLVNPSSSNGYTVKEVLDQKWGSDARSLIESVITDLQSPRSAKEYQHEWISQILNTVQSGFVVATLAGNLQVAIKQAASYPTAAAVLSWASLAKGMSGFMGGQELYDEIDEHTGLHYIRRQGLSDSEIGDLTQKKSWVTKIPTAANPMKWIQLIDVRTTAAIWVACKAEIESTTKYKVGSDEYWNAVTRLYERAITETQPNYDVLHRPEIQKTTNRLVKSIVMFRTQPLQNSGILYDAAHELIQRNKENKASKSDESAKALTAAKKKFAKAITSQTTSLIVFSLMTLIGQALKHKMFGFRDDDDKVTLASIIKGGIMNSLEVMSGLIAPIGGSELYSLAQKLIGKSTYDAVSVPSIQMIDDYFNLASKVVKTTNALRDADKKSGETAALVMALANLVTKTLDFKGIPATNIYALVKGLVYHGIDAANKYEYGAFEMDDKFFTEPVKTRYNRMFTLYDKGKPQDASEQLMEIIALQKKEGKEDKDIASGFKTRFAAHYKQRFIDGDANTRSQIITYMVNSGMYGSRDDVTKYINTHWLKD